MGKLEHIQTLSKHVGRVWNLSWHPKGDCLGSCGEDKTIRIWVKESGGKWTNKAVLTEAHKRTIRSISWSPCGKFLAAASFDGTVSIWDKKSGEFECNATLEGHENEVKSVAWSRSGNLLSTCSRDKSVWVWEVAEDDEYECAAVLSAHTQDVKRVIWHPNSDILASCSYDNTIKLFTEDLSDNDWTCASTLVGHTSTVWSITFDKTGDRLASCSDDASVKIWKCDAETSTALEPNYKCICTLSGYHTRMIYDVSWCHFNDVIATGCGDDIIRVFKEDVGSDPEAPTFSLAVSVEPAHGQDVNCVTWNPVVGGLLASCSDDGEIKLWKYSE